MGFFGPFQLDEREAAGYKESRNELSDLHKDTNLTAGQKREQAVAIRKEAHEKIMAHLNPEQQDKLKKHTQQVRREGLEQGKQPTPKQ